MNLPGCIIAMLVFGLSISAQIVDENAFSFEHEDDWTSLPPGLRNSMREFKISETDLWCSQSYRNSCWKLDPVTLAELERGLVLSTDTFIEGKHSGLWEHLERFPSIATQNIPHDWSNADTISLWINSAGAESSFMLLVISDNPDTPYKDFYYCKVNPSGNGWKRYTLPFSDFAISGNPSGWHKTDGIFFCAAAFGLRPNPNSKYYIDTIALEKVLPHAPEKKKTEPDFVYLCKFKDQPPPLNHNQSETSHPDAVITPHKFISHQSYFRAERDLYAYYPRFSPGYPSFDPEGKVYIYSGDIVQFLKTNNDWEVYDLKPELISWAKKQNWKGFYNAWGAQGGDTTIRFDKDGDVYLMVQAEELDSSGNFVNWKTRCTLLLHSSNKMKNWNIYKLPGRIASFEKLDGHNSDCLKRPPVILYCDYRYFPGTDQGAWMLLPKKNADGSLDLSRMIKYADDCIGINYHSGDANVVLTIGRKIILAYGWAPESSSYPELTAKLSAGGKNFHEQWKLSILKNTSLAHSLPYIPTGHPGLKLSSRYRMHYGISSEYPVAESADGVPVFVRSYDLGTGKLSSPIYIGSGGGSIDSHNWPAITIDGNGIIHALINGHHNPAVYTHTLNPYDISSWSTPEYVIPGTETPLLSYATLNCDADNTLYSVHRSTSNVYNNRLSLFRKRSGRQWEMERTLVAPFKGLYYVWYHKMTYDPFFKRLFLTYFSQTRQSFMSRDMYEFLIFRRQEQEQQLCHNYNRHDKDNSGPIPMNANPHWDTWSHGAMYNPDASEICTIYSADKGDSWRLLTTDAFNHHVADNQPDHRLEIDQRARHLTKLKVYPAR